MRLLGIMSWVVTLTSLLIILVITLNYVIPPFTDISQVLFLEGKGYLPREETIARLEIAHALPKLLAYERQNYTRIFYLTITTLGGLAGIHVSNRCKIAVTGTENRYKKAPADEAAPH